MEHDCNDSCTLVTVSVSIASRPYLKRRPCSQTTTKPNSKDKSSVGQKENRVEHPLGIFVGVAVVGRQQAR